MKLSFKPQSALIMGIVNVTPDSFSGDGLIKNNLDVGMVVEQARQMLTDGADILDIGGESARPGAKPVSSDEEMDRVIPAIEALRQQLGTAPVLSVDTTKPQVAEAALLAGADIINDISALGADPAMMDVVVRHQCPMVLMHNRAKAQPGDVIEEIAESLIASIETARQAGVTDSNIILDPGIGFGKTPQQNMALIKNIPRFKQLGFPILMGPSRKSFIGLTLDLPVDERLEGTASTVAVCSFLGADIIRVHDVKFMVRVAKMAAAIRQT